MDKSKFNPNAPFCVEVYEASISGKPRTFGVKDLTFKQAQEYHGRMNEDSKFQFFRMYEDGTRKDINMEGYQMQFAIWKRGYISAKAGYQAGALMELCETEAEANKKLALNYDESHFIEPF